jgi:crotonobetaine/carnitine-CoA ligase
MSVLTTVGDRTVIGLLEAGSADHPSRVLLTFDDLEGTITDYTWREVLERSWECAMLLSELGVAAGGRVHLHLPNRPEFLFAWFGCAALGVSIIPSNILATADELAYTLAHSEAAISITDDRGEETVHAASGPQHMILNCDERPLTSSAATERPVSRPDASCDLGLLYTSGTTSRPKGVRVTQANYVYAGEVVSRHIGIGSEDRVLTVLPLFHANAQYYTTMSCLVTGARLVLSARFSASRLLDQAVEHGATVTSLFAAPIRMILAQPPRKRWREHRLRVVLFAQNLTAAEHVQWDEVVGAPLLQIYGMTETIGPPMMNPIHQRERRHQTIGRPSLGYSCRVIREDGRSAAVGEVGELSVQGVPGVSLMRGYLNDEQATASVLREGWLFTGDLVRLEPGGFVSFVDRRGDMIKRAGENVAASEVERVLLDHPQVQDAAVFGVPDPVRDAKIIAVVVAAEGGEGEPLDDRELLTWCSQRLARFRVPSEVLIVTELPRTSVGKIQKHVLRTQWAATHAGEA